MIKPQKADLYIYHWKCTNAITWRINTDSIQRSKNENLYKRKWNKTMNYRKLLRF